MTPPPQDPHPDWADFGQSWELSLNADGYARNTLLSYPNALRQLATWLAAQHPGVGPLDVTREHVRAWIVHVREASSSGTARSWFAGVRHFFRWLVAEGERDEDPTAQIKTPAPNAPTTPVLSLDDIRALISACSGRTFVDRRDAAIVYVFLDGGLRLAEVAGLEVNDIQLRDRLVMVRGKGSNRSGPRIRQVSISVKGTQALDRYLRERRKHPHTERSSLWLGDRGRATLSADGIERALERRAAVAGLKFHPHVLRHTWASQARAAGLSEGDLMTLGGWRSRAMLDRYGAAVAAERAQEAYRRMALGDRL